MSSLIKPTDVFDDFYRPFGSLLAQGFPSRLLADSDVWMPAADVRRDGDGYVIDMEVPGFKPDQINVEAHDNVLTIEGERSDESEEKQEDTGYIRRERRYGKFTRRFTLPAGVDAEAIGAQVTDGVLHVSIPSATANGPQKITVE